MSKNSKLEKLKKLELGKYTRSMWWLIPLILLIWIGALLLGSAILTWVEELTSEKTYNFGLVLAFIGGSLIIAIPLTIIAVNLFTKTVDRVNYSFGRVADGDFTTKLELKSNNTYVNEMVINFNKMVDQLNSVAIMKNDFISTFSHEFKTPMVSIKGYAELLSGNDNLTPEQQEYVKIIISESKRLSTLAEKVLMVSKLDSQVINSEKTTFRVDAQLEECILLLDGAMQEKNIELNANLKKVKISADAGLIKEIWINLLNNAVKYTGVGGKIDVLCYQENKNAVVVIKDNGTGISEENLPYIFDKFYQGNAKKSYGGLGLGLTLCKKITESFNGTITCESKVGEGSTFTVTIPQN